MYRIFGKRILDILLSMIGLIVSIPLFVVVALLIKADSSGPVFFRQKRMGKNGQFFYLLKFRSMEPDKLRESKGFEPGMALRVTKMGKFLRKTKLDEIPQLVNVFLGEMSFVGPRPEVERYLDAYSGKFEEVLKVRPGITDMASIKYRNEEYLLAKNTDPHRFYEETILPDKLEIALKYVHGPITFGNDTQIILQTLSSVLERRKHEENNTTS